MTPKEKAKELIDKYIEISGIYVGGYQNEKQMCLIAVDEIISYINRMNQVLPQHLSLEGWQKVKQEIENYDTKPS